jgi:hypothetical protein
MARLVVPGPFETFLSGHMNASGKEMRTYCKLMGLDPEGEGNRRYERDKDRERPSDGTAYERQNNIDSLGGEAFLCAIVSRLADFSDKSSGDDYDCLLDGIPFQKSLNELFEDTRDETKLKYDTREFVINPNKVCKADIFTAAIGTFNDGYEFLTWTTSPDLCNYTRWCDLNNISTVRQGNGPKFIYPIGNPKWPTGTFAQLCNHIATGQPICPFVKKDPRHTPRGTLDR